MSLNDSERSGNSLREETTLEDNLIDRYKDLIREDDNKKELYKWRLVQDFQNKWDIHADDFAGMLKSLEFGNLMYYGSKDFIRNANKYPEKAREMFRDLFDEEKDLHERIVDFKVRAEELFEKHFPEKNAAQNERPISVYLTCRYPEKYTFYKYSYYKEFADLLAEDIPPAGSRYAHYLTLIDRFIKEYVQKDEDLIRLSQNTLTGDCYKDNNHKILAQDILFRTIEGETVSEDAFKDTLQSLGYKDSNRFFTYLDDIINDLGVSEDERIHYSVRTDHDRLTFVVGQRYCLMVQSGNSNNRWGFVHPNDDLSKGKNKGDFSGPPQATWYESEDFGILAQEYTKILQAVRSEYKRTNKSVFRKYNNSFFEDASLDKSYRGELFNELFGKQPDMSKNKYSWVETHKEIAEKLLGYRNRQKELINILKESGATVFSDKDESGETVELSEIDPFTFFRYINKYGDERRLEILKSVAKKLDVDVIPHDTLGLPTSNPTSVWLFKWKKDRDEEIDKLWEMYEQVLNNNIDEELWDQVLSFYNIGKSNFTQGLFTVSPENYLPIDQHTISYLEEKFNINTDFSTFEEYKSILEEIRSTIDKPFYEISIDAYNWNQAPNYWWINADPDKWQVEQKEVGEKHSYTTHTSDGNPRRVYKNFENLKPGDLMICYETKSSKRIKAILEVTDGLYEDEEGIERITFEIKQFTPNQPTWSELQSVPELQDCDVLKNNQDSLFSLTKEEYHNIYELAFSDVGEPQYEMDDALREVFMKEDKLQNILDLLKYKKNIILQGPPGTGKTFLAKRLAWLMSGVKDPNRIEVVQFHQSYSYEDFIRGYRPTDNHFELKDGIFMQMCKRAKSDPENKPYFLVIDEINRGNLSKIFGELMMLIENDKRGPDFTVKLPYQKDVDEPDFYIPKNLHLIGTMNTADRSLAMVDYALRRRFVFIDMMPNFGDKFQDHLKEKGIQEHLVETIVDRLRELNTKIADKQELGPGPGYQIGHSYFCGSKNGDEDWYKNIIKYEIIPLLNEYWFDKPTKVEEVEEQLLTI